MDIPQIYPNIPLIPVQIQLQIHKANLSAQLCFQISSQTFKNVGAFSISVNILFLNYLLLSTKISGVAWYFKLHIMNWLFGMRLVHWGLSMSSSSTVARVLPSRLGMIRTKLLYCDNIRKPSAIYWNQSGEMKGKQPM